MKTHHQILIALLLFVGLVLASRKVLAVTEIPEIGPHTPLIKVEKNENPQNLMIVYTKLDPGTCKFGAQPVLDEYWLMDGSKYKKVNPMIKNAVTERFELDKKAAGEGKFLVHLKDFNELKSDLGSSPTFEVFSKKGVGGCKADVVMQLGPSDQGRKISIESIYADSSKTLLPPFRSLKSLTLRGRDVATGKPVERKYNAN